MGMEEKLGEVDGSRWKSLATLLLNIVEVLGNLW